MCICIFVSQCIKCHAGYTYQHWKLYPSGNFDLVYSYTPVTSSCVAKCVPVGIGNQKNSLCFKLVKKQVSVINVTGSGKTGLIDTSTEIQFLSISERYTHALPRNTKYLAVDGQVCFYRRLFADAVKPRRCMSWGALIGLHGVPNCSSQQSWPSL